MNPALVLKFASVLLENLPRLIEAGANVYDLVNTGNAKLKAMQDEQRDPTPAEWDELNAKIRVLQEELHKP